MLHPQAGVYHRGDKVIDLALIVTDSPSGIRGRGKRGKNGMENVPPLEYGGFSGKSTTEIPPLGLPSSDREACPCGQGLDPTARHSPVPGPV